MNTEELLREIVSKICPFHGKKAMATLHKDGRIEVTACCKEFQQFLEAFQYKRQNKTNNESGSEIISDP